MSNLDALRYKRSHLKGTTTRLDNFLSQVVSETSLFEIRARLEKLEKIYDEFHALDIEMAAQSEQFPERESEMEEFERRYYRMKTNYAELIETRLYSTNIGGEALNSTTMQQDAMQKLLETQSALLEKLSALQLPPQGSSQSMLAQSMNTSSQSADVRLPKLNVPVFQGKYSEFKTFFDLFNSSIHNNNALSAAQKFQYLKSLLSEEPAALIRHLPVSDQNYAEALNKLKERYDKPSLVVDSFVETFLTIPKADTTTGLRAVSNIADEVIRGLRAQGAEAEKRDPWLINILCKKIDRDTQQAWAEEYGKVEFPSLDSFIAFIGKRCDVLERLPNQDVEKNAKPNFRGKTSRAYAGEMKKGCAACTQNHHLSYCPIFCKMDVPSRNEFIKQKFLCFNCLKPNHRTRNCSSKHVCQSCGGHHHSMLHVDRMSSNKFGNVSVNNTKSNGEPNNAIAALERATLSNNSSTNVAASSEVRHINMLLPTARVLVKDKMGCYQICYALLDSGCQNTLITERCAQRLGLSRKPSKIFVSGLGDNKAGATKGAVELQVKSVYSSDQITILAHVFRTLTSLLPSSPVTINYWDEIKDLQLADNRFDAPKQIDLLIGFDYFFSLIRDGRIEKNGILLAQNTAFGWVICNGCMADGSIIACHVIYQGEYEEDLNKMLRLFWEFETLKSFKQTLTEEDQAAEDLYCSTTIRSNKYSVRLPFKHTPDLGESYTAAMRRLMAMERKFKSNPNLKKAYSEFMSEYVSLGHMQLVPDNEINRSAAEICYLPHHAVLKDNSLTTKLRVVFDGSSKTSNGKSLNDNLLKGPVLQQDLMAVILRYRCTKYCFAADIKQMFRMIEVQACDRDYQRILWRENPDDKIQHYRLTTVTYGTTPAPYLSIRTLLKLAEDEEERYPLASKTIKTCFYVDDCMAGSNTVSAAQELAGQLNDLLTAGGFRLRKWATNNSSVLRHIPESDKIESIVNLPTDNTVCLLGVIWNPLTDCFSYRVKNDKYCIESKRTLLSEISKIYDPLGWIAPVIIAVKIIIQKLWLLNMSWDERLPIEIINRANELFSEFHLLNNINIPRILFSTETSVTYHGFCDASSAAYAAVVYCRKTSADGEVSSNIVMAKTKVAPLSMVSIPRLELCAAYLLAQLFEYLILVLNIVDQSNITCWSDSKTVLSWLSSHPSKWKTFVSHRTGYILETLPDVKWRYISTKLNPADCASRGVRSSYLVNNQLWFQGPQFIINDESEWPNRQEEIFETNEELRGKHQVTLLSTAEDGVIFTLNERISRWPKIIRVLTYVLRACTAFRSKCRLYGPLQIEEMREAEIHIFKHYQQEHFSHTIEAIKTRKVISSKKLKRLSPFLDQNGILRVGGRLTNSELPYDSQHQIILHKDCPIAIKIVRDCHLRNLHAGVTLLIATLRQRYWIVGARDLAKRVCRKCLVCHRYSAKVNDQLMGDLPKFRVNAAYPFYEVGCDYAGPIMYKQHNGRKSPIVKAYIAVFICLVTKAVHLELVSDLSTDTFLAALDRFVARRGLCGHIHSDNGTNFQGAAKKLGEIYKSVTKSEFNTNVSNFLSSKGIQWHFIPPGAPHFGGVWESTVKRMKYHLRRTLGLATLNFEELTTVLARIEAILNSRPLVQADSDDLPYISPGHFLVGRPLNALPEVDITQLKTSALSKWRVIQQLTQYYWSRWAGDYLQSLQPKAKWLKRKRNISVDEVVLLRGENLPPTHWKLGKVIATHTGADGLVRVATVKTDNSTFKRPITKLYPLPKDD